MTGRDQEAVRAGQGDGWRARRAPSRRQIGRKGTVSQMADGGAAAAAEGPIFPRELLRELMEAAPAGSKLRLLTAGGAGVTVARIVKETESGLIVESVEGQFSAIPWHTVLRADTARPDAGRAVGFRAE